MKTLRLLPAVRIITTFQIQEINENIRITINLENSSNSIAFFLRIKIVNKNTKKVIVPLLWNENCINLLPYGNHEIKGNILNNNDKNINSLK